jgi:glucose/arabinose dehydrogenase
MRGRSLSTRRFPRPVRKSGVLPTLALLATILLEPVVTGLDRPVQVVTANDHSGRLFIAEQSGRILVVDRPGDAPRLFRDLRSRVECCENGGLLSIAFHPTDGRLFALYVDRRGDTAVARILPAFELLFTVDQPADNRPNHHGGTLQFGPDGHLWISIGDGGANVSVTERAQDRTTFFGKLLRIDVDRGTPYAIPPDNPLVGHLFARTELWSLGLRNPWRFSFDRVTGDLFIADVGQHLYEEINILTIAEARLANFGWPRMEGRHCFPAGSECDAQDLTLPAIEYPRGDGCSATGGYVYRGRKWSSLYGDYVYGDWCTGRIWRATQRDGRWTSKELADTDLAIVSFGEDDEGELYVVDYNGAVFRLTAPASRRRAIRH